MDDNNRTDNMLGYWIYNRPYVWIGSDDARKCWRLYLVYDDDNVFIAPGKVTAARNIIDNKSDEAFVMDVWNNSVQDKPCLWVARLFGVYVPSRDGPVQLNNIRINGEEAQRWTGDYNHIFLLQKNNIYPSSVNKIYPQINGKLILPKGVKQVRIMKPKPQAPLPVDGNVNKKRRILPTFMTKKKVYRAQKSGTLRPDTVRFNDWVGLMKIEKERYERLKREIKDTPITKFSVKITGHNYDIENVRIMFINMSLYDITLTKVKGYVREYNKKVASKLVHTSLWKYLNDHFIAKLWVGDYYKYEKLVDFGALDMFHSDISRFNKYIEMELNAKEERDREAVLREEAMKMNMTFDIIREYIDNHYRELKDLDEIVIIEHIENDLSNNDNDVELTPDLERRVIEYIDARKAEDIAREEDVSLQVYDFDSFMYSPPGSPIGSVNSHGSRVSSELSLDLSLDISDDEGPLSPRVKTALESRVGSPLVDSQATVPLTFDEIANLSPRGRTPRSKYPPRPAREYRSVSGSKSKSVDSQAIISPSKLNDKLKKSVTPPIVEKNSDDKFWEEFMADTPKASFVNTLGSPVEDAYRYADDSDSN